MEQEDLDYHESVFDSNNTGCIMSKLTLKCTTEAQRDVMPDRQYCINVRKLNSAQYKIVMYNHTGCKRCVKGINEG